MSKANIYFSDGSIIEISENDIIITVTPRSDGKSKFSSIDKTVDLQCHLNNGLIPSILDALCFCDFFYIGGNADVIYGAKSIVKIENV